MKKIFLIIFSSLLAFLVSAQVDKSKINSAYLNFLPSSSKPEDLRPSDIPSEQVLKQMGLSNEEIYEAMNFKYQRGKYGDDVLDADTTFETKISKFYNSMEDHQYTKDSIIFPKERAVGRKNG